MIQPDDIRRTAENLYPTFLRAWLDRADGFFPRVIRGRKRPPAGDLSSAIEMVRHLRAESKEIRGFGYVVQWEEVNSRDFGRNQFPSQIRFDTQDDYLRFIGKREEFTRFAVAAAELRSAYPQLAAWVRSHIQVLIEVAPDLPGLLHVLRYFEANLRPGRFARELPLPIDTKFIERHQQLLREWFDVVLPPQSIRADEDHFERRYGLRYPEPHLLVRLLDEELRRELGFPCSEFSLPLQTLGELAVERANAIIVENKVNLLTLPSMSRWIGLGALGSGVTLLRHVPWLHSVRVIYWGDLDVEGFEILSSLRSIFPQVESLMMDQETLVAWNQLAGRGNGSVRDFHRLTNGERAALQCCCEENVRLEQERIPHEAVLAAFARLTAQPAHVDQSEE